MKGMHRKLLGVVFVSAAMLAAILTFITTNQKITTAIGADDYCLYIPKDIEERVASLNRLADEYENEIVDSYDELTDIWNSVTAENVEEFYKSDAVKEIKDKINERTIIFNRVVNKRIEVMGDLANQPQIRSLFKAELSITRLKIMIAQNNHIAEVAGKELEVLSDLKEDLLFELDAAADELTERRMLNVIQDLDENLITPRLGVVAKYHLEKKAVQSRLEIRIGYLNGLVKRFQHKECSPKLIKNLLRGSVYSIIGSICLSLTVDELFASPPSLTEEQTTPPSITPPPTDKPLPDLSE